MNMKMKKFDILLAILLALIVSVVYVFLSVKGLFEVNWFFVILSIGFFSIFFLFLPYRKYKRSVPMLIPRIQKKKQKEKAH